MTTYDIGDRPVVVASFTDDEGAAADPSAITFSVKDPSNNVATGDQTDASNPSVGTWHWPLPTAVDEAGEWWVRVEATAGLQTAEELSFQVRPSEFA